MVAFCLMENLIKAYDLLLLFYIKQQLNEITTAAHSYLIVCIQHIKLQSQNVPFYRMYIKVRRHIVPCILPQLANQQLYTMKNFEFINTLHYYVTQSNVTKISVCLDVVLPTGLAQSVASQPHSNRHTCPDLQHQHLAVLHLVLQLQDTSCKQADGTEDLRIQSGEMTRMSSAQPPVSTGSYGSHLSISSLDSQL